MNCKRPLALCVATLTTALLAFNAYAESREWTQAATGKKLSAEYVGMKGEATVELKLANGAVVAVPVAGLSAEDQEFIKAQSMPKPAAGASDKPKGKIPEGETTVTVSGVGLFSSDCEEAIEQAMVTAKEEEGKNTGDVTLEISRADGTVKLTAATGAEVKDALWALNNVGFWGETDHDALKVPFKGGGADLTTDVMTMKDVTLCCSKRVRAFEKAVESVDGVEESDAKEGASSIKITGEGFVPSQVTAALRAAGFGGSWR